MSYDELKIKEAANNGFVANVAGEIDQSSGTFVPLGEIKLPKTEKEDLLSGNWNSPAERNFQAPVKHFEPMTGTKRDAAVGNENEEETETTGGANSRAAAGTANSSSPSDAIRQKTEQAIAGEEKKTVNPRIIKTVIGVIVVIALVGVVMLSMKGEKRKSLLSKDKPGETTEQSAGEVTGKQTAGDENSSGADETRKSVKFGDIQVGNDPAGQSSEDNLSPESTEEAKKTENVEPSPNTSPTPTNAFMPNYSNQSASQNYGGGTNTNPVAENPVSTGGGETVSEKTPNEKKVGKGDLAETPLGVETDEQRFHTVMRAGQNRSRTAEITPVGANNALGTEMPAGGAPLPRGTRVELLLEDPIRSGIATAVTAKVRKGVVNKRGETIIPKDSMVIVSFSAEVANGRVFNDKGAKIQIVTQDGRNYEVAGMVKDAQGFAGLTGKITKVGGRSMLGKIGGVLGRVGGALPGGQIIAGTQQSIEGMSDNGGYVTNATQIVEIPRGTSFLLIVGY